MNTIEAIAIGEANRGKEPMVFDWDKAANLIKESGFKDARAGLSQDLEFTCGTIFEYGKPVFDDYTYLASTWAKPLIIIDDDFIECYVMQSENKDWDSGTKWPETSLKILNDK